MRCYNGCPDDELQALINERARVKAAIVAAGYTVTYFPEGEFYSAFKDYRPITGECKTLHAVAHELGVKI